MSIVTVGGNPRFKEDYAYVGARSKMLMTPYGIMSQAEFIERKKKEKEKKKLLAPKPIIQKNMVAKSKFDDTDAPKDKKIGDGNEDD